jgi:hypothetical protein
MAKIYDLSVYRDAKSIAKNFKLAEIEREAKSLEAYIVMLNSNVPFGTLDPNFDGDRDLLRRLEVWKLALKLSTPQGD